MHVRMHAHVHTHANASRLHGDIPMCEPLTAKSTYMGAHVYVHGHVREQELENRCTVTLADGVKETGLLLRPWGMRLHKIGHKELVENQRKGLYLDDCDGKGDNGNKMIVTK